MDQAQKKYPSQPIGNCQKCAKTYGTLGCCDVVNNEVQYYCEAGQAEFYENEKKKVFLALTENEAACLANHLQLSILTEIHECGDDYDNLEYLSALCSIYMRCKPYV